MATGPTFEQDVVLDADGQPVFNALAKVDQYIKQIEATIQNIGRQALNSVNDVNRSVVQTAKQLSQAQSAMKTIQTATPGTIPNLNADRSLARASEQAAQYGRGIESATTAEQGLLAKINEVNKAISERARLTGRPSTLGQSAELNDLNAQLTALKALDREYAAMEARGRRTGIAPSNNQQMARQLTTLTALDPKGDMTQALQLYRQANDEQLANIQRVRDARAAQLREDRAAIREEEKYYRELADQKEKLEAEAASATDKAYAQRDKAAKAFESAESQRMRQMEQAWEQHEQRMTEATKRGQEARGFREIEASNSAPGLSQNDRALEEQGLRQASAARAAELEADAQRQRNAAALTQGQYAARVYGVQQQAYGLGSTAERDAALAASTAAVERLRAAQATVDSPETQNRIKQAIALEEARQSALRQSEAAYQREKRQQEQQDRQDANSSLLGRTGTALFNTALYGGVVTALYGVVSATEQAFSSFVKLEDAMDILQAISGSTDGQMQALKASILEVGQNSRYSNTEITQAAQALAQAGFSSQGIAEGLQAAANLATASGSSIKEATDLITSAIGAFHLQESEQARVSDVLTAALNRTKLTATQVSQAIQYAGATAAEQNISFNQLTATIGALAQAGIKSGSTIGTGLRQFLIELQTPNQKLSDEMRKLGLTFDDIDVKTKGLVPVLNTLKTAGFGSAEAYGALETRSAAAYLVLANNTDLISKLAIQEAQAGVAAEAAGKGMQSFAAQWQLFKNNLQDETAGPIGKTVDIFTELLKLINSNESLGNVNAQYAKPFDDLQKSFDSGKISAQQYADQFDDLTQKYDATKQVLADVTNLHDEYDKRLDDSATRAATLSDAQNTQRATMQSLQEAMDTVVQHQGSLKDGSLELQAQTAELGTRFVGLSRYLDGAATSYGGLTAALRTYQQQQLAGLGNTLIAQQNTFGQQSQTAYGAANSAYRDILGQSKLLTPDQLAAVKALGRDPNNFSKLTTVNEIAQSVKGPLGQLLQQFASYTATSVNANQNRLQAGVDLQTVRAARTPLAQSIQAKVQAAATGKDSDIAAAQSAIDNEAKSSGLTSGGRAYLAQLQDQLNGYKGNQGSLKAPKVKKTRTSNRSESNDAFLNNQDVSLADKLLTATESVGKTILTEDDFDKTSERINQALADDIKARRDKLASDITAKKLNPEQAAQLTKTVQGQIDSLTETTQKKIGELFSQFIDNATKAADVAYKNALAKSQANVSLQQGLDKALTRLDVKDRVPDYVTTLQSRRTARAQEDLDKATIPANDQKIKALQGIADATQNRINDLGFLSGGDDSAANLEIANLNSKLLETKTNIQDLTNANTALKASFTGADLLPKSFGDALKQAAEAYRDVHGLNNTFEDDLKGSLTGAIGIVDDKFQQFATDVATGSKGILGAFGDMVQGIIKEFESLIAKLIAKQIFGSLLKGIGGGGGGLLSIFGLFGGGKAGGGDPGSDLDAVYRYGGGPIGFDSGGKVTNGSDSHDSVKAKLAKGEWVVNKKAVDSVGDQFMANLNASGAKAVTAMQSVPKLDIKMPMQNTNVYVVKPDQQPTLSKNDVLVTFQEDVLSGGETKKLIKAVSQGY